MVVLLTSGCDPAVRAESRVELDSIDVLDRMVKAVGIAAADVGADGETTLSAADGGETGPCLWDDEEESPTGEETWVQMRHSATFDPVPDADLFRTASRLRDSFRVQGFEVEEDTLDVGAKPAEPGEVTFSRAEDGIRGTLLAGSGSITLALASPCVPKGGPRGGLETP